MTPENTNPSTPENSKNKEGTTSSDAKTVEISPTVKANAKTDPSTDPSMVEQKARVASTAIKDALNKIPAELKIVISGAFIAFIGSFLPWWSVKSIGPYGNNFSVNAFEDSTFLLGVLVFLGSILAIVIVVFEILNKKPSFIKLPHSVIQLIIGSEMTLLMLIAISIFTSPRFSVSSTAEAGPSFGSFMTIIGSAIIAVGGFLEWKGNSFFTQVEQKSEGKETGPAEKK